jgi:hypothetical protein
MEDFLMAQLLLPEPDFLAEVAANTAALAIDMTSGLIIYANTKAESLFRCGVKNGLSRIPYEQLIPSELRGRHLKHAASYEKNPHPRAMGDRKMELRALTLDGESFPVAITLNPIQKHDRRFVILTFMPLPKQEAD